MKDSHQDRPPTIRTLDDIARLRINPGLRYKHRVDEDAPGALSLFLGNTREHLPHAQRAHWVLPDALSNIVELRTDDIVIQNHLDRETFHVFRIEARDLPSVLSVHYTKVIPRDAHCCRGYLLLALRVSLARVAREWLAQDSPPRALSLRALRELTLYWPEQARQETLVEEHEMLLRRYRHAQEALGAFEQRLHAPARTGEP